MPCLLPERILQLSLCDPYGAYRSCQPPTRPFPWEDGHDGVLSVPPPNPSAGVPMVPFHFLDVFPVRGWGFRLLGLLGGGHLFRLTTSGEAGLIFNPHPLRRFICIESRRGILAGLFSVGALHFRFVFHSDFYLLYPINEKSQAF